MEAPSNGRNEGVQIMNINGEPQVVHVMSLKDSTAFTKALASHHATVAIKSEEVAIVSD